MSINKILGDKVSKFFYPRNTVPEGVLEWTRYARDNDGLTFKIEKVGDVFTAKSMNFRYGSIVTSGKDEKELEGNIKDAIFTAFEIPSSYSKEAGIVKEEGRGSERVYVAA